MPLAEAARIAVEVGQFLSVDPVGVDPTGGANFNRYWYGNDNPYKFVDPDGMLACQQDEQPCSDTKKAEERRNERRSKAGSGFVQAYYPVAGIQIPGPGAHAYKEANIGCNPNCTKEEVVDALSRFSMPGRDSSEPIEHLQAYLVRDGDIPIGFVRVEISEDGLTITNHTTTFHLLHKGKIVRSARQGADGTWTISTTGTGINYVPGMARANALRGPEIWRELDSRLRGYLERTER